MKTRKIMSLLLVVAMMLSIFAMTASAATNALCTCSHCGAYANHTEVEYPHYVMVNYTPVSGCARMDGFHNHYYSEICTLFTCRACGKLFTVGSGQYTTVCMDGKPI